MDIDIRLPIGFMFSILGIMLTLFGIFTTGDADLYARSLGININLWSGVAMLIFGLLMLFFGWRGKKAEKKI
jgi:hypothetical protein